MKARITVPVGILKVCGYRPYRFRTLAEAQRVFVKARDESGLGVSGFGHGKITFRGRALEISYNGRIWNRAGESEIEASADGEIREVARQQEVAP
jgi:hypothetical protein